MQQSGQGAGAVFRKLLKAYTSRQEAGSADLRGIVRRFCSDQRGGVAVIAGVSFIPLIMIVGLGVEVTHWTVVKAELQRTVDLAALAGAKEYLVAANFENTVNAAANLAELNDRALGGASRTWDPTSKLLTVNRISAQVMDGLRNQNGKAVKVVASQAVPLMLTKVMGATLPVTITATGWAEVLAAAVQPCLLALDSNGTGVSVQGNVTLNLTGCSVRSNATISTGGNSANMSAAGFYAAGTITGSGYTGDLFPNDGTVSDPYATYSPVTDALNKLNPGHGTPFRENNSGSTQLSPSQAPDGWPGWTHIKGTVTLASGIYYVNGNISLEGQGRLTGIGVTIIMSGILSMDGGSTINLSASKTGAETGGAIKGIVFAGNSTERSTFYGNTAPSLTGVVYYPKGALDFGGTAGGGSTGCLEVVAKSVTLKGNPSLAAVCQDYGTLPISRDGSTGATPTASLVR